VTWGGQGNDVFNYLATAFMQSITPGVDTLLDAGILVSIESGNLDLICCTPGTLNWMKQLKWSDMPGFWNAQRSALSLNQTVVSFKKHYKNLRMYNILAAGHMVPHDQPGAGQQMLVDIIGSQ